MNGFFRINSSTVDRDRLKISVYLQEVARLKTLSVTGTVLIVFAGSGSTCITRLFKEDH